MKATPISSATASPFAKELPEVTDKLGQRVRVDDLVRPMGWPWPAAKILKIERDGFDVRVHIQWLAFPTQDAIDMTRAEFAASSWLRCGHEQGDHKSTRGARASGGAA